jgi:hypothetical protein
VGFGQVKYDVTQPQLTITLDQPVPVRLPPAGNEFGTNLAFGNDFDDAGGQTATLRYTGAVAALVQLEATMSFERIPGSSSQHVFIGWAVGAPPIDAADLSADTRQETDLAFDEQDAILHVQGAFMMNPGDEGQVWVKRTNDVPEENMLFKVTGYMLSATVVGGGVAPSAGGRGNLVFDPGEPSTSFVLPDGSAAKLPPASEFKTNLVHAQDFIMASEGSLKYTGAQQLCRISGTITLQRDQGLDSDLTLFVNAAPAPTDGTKDLPTSQSYRVNVSDQDDILHVEGLFPVAPDDFVQLWASRAPGASPFLVKVLGYSLTITAA